jgi:hypothetical protein
MLEQTNASTLHTAVMKNIIQNIYSHTITKNTSLVILWLERYRTAYTTTHTENKATTPRYQIWGVVRYRTAYTTQYSMVRIFTNTSVNINSAIRNWREHSNVPSQVIKEHDFREQYVGSRNYGSHNPYFEQVKIDALHICSPTSSQEEESQTAKILHTSTKCKIQNSIHNIT